MIPTCSGLTAFRSAAKQQMKGLVQEADGLRAELASAKQQSDQQEQQLRSQLHSLRQSLDHARAQNTALENR